MFGKMNFFFSRKILVAMCAIVLVDFVHPVAGSEHGGSCPGKPDVTGVVGSFPLISGRALRGVPYH